MEVGSAAMDPLANARAEHAILKQALRRVAQQRQGTLTADHLKIVDTPQHWLLFRPESAALVAALQRLALAALMHPRLSSHTSIDVLDDDVVQLVVAKLVHLPSRPGLKHPTAEGLWRRKYWVVPPVVLRDDSVNIRRLYRQARVHHEAVADVFDLGQDHDGWNRLDVFVRHVALGALGFHVASSRVVLDFVSRFAQEVRRDQSPEAHSFYRFQMRVKSEAAKPSMDNVFCEDVKCVPSLRNTVTAITQHDVVKVKLAWCQDWLRFDTEISSRLVASAAIELIFSATWYILVRYQSMIVDPANRYGIGGFSYFANNSLETDQQLHCQFACQLYKSLGQQLLAEEVQQIILSAVETEKQFARGVVHAVYGNSEGPRVASKWYADDILRGCSCCNVPGSPGSFSECVVQRCEAAADWLLHQLECPALFHWPQEKMLELRRERAERTQGLFWAERARNLVREPIAQASLCFDDLDF